jgi:hypothetical protein
VQTGGGTGGWVVLRSVEEDYDLGNQQSVRSRGCGLGDAVGDNVAGEVQVLGQVDPGL